MKSLTSLWSITARELAVRCCTSADRDITTVTARAENEGLSFLAITLANYGKAIEKWLDQGFVVPSDVSSFRKSHRTGLPAFLQGFLGRVFCSTSGVLFDTPDIEAIYALRQLTLMFSKIALPVDSLSGKSNAVVTPQRERRAMLEYIECEQDVKRSDSLLDPSFLEDFKRISRLLFGDMFDKVAREVHWNRLTPKHGPGAVADRLSSNGKFNLRTWPSRLQRCFPAEDFLIPNRHFLDDLKKELTFLEPGSEIPVRVITVPKTLKAPRVIAVEPTAMQYAQQALFGVIRRGISEDGFLRDLVGIDDQEPNRLLAQAGSLSGDLATLDLSEASDRVSFQHVRALLDGVPDLLQAVDSCRSRKADVPGFGVQRLAKFASMGSALCFPFEAMVFATVIFIGIEQELNTPLTSETIKSFQGKVRVFGDDIIVPRDYVLSVVDTLHLFGYVVNVSKSFWTGRFRESCGREFYDGQDVSIVKVRQILPTRRQHASGIISAVSLRNQLYWAGLWQSARWMDNYIGRLIKVYPTVAPSSPLLGRESSLGYEFQRLHPNYLSPLTRGYYEVAKSPRDPLDGAGALLKCLLRKPWSGFGLPPETELRPSFGDANVDDQHLERAGRPEHVSIKLGWRPPY